MTPLDERKRRERNDVLEAFLEACPIPSADETKEWMRTHPHHADAILDHACGIWRVAHVLEPTPIEPTPDQFDAAWARYRERAAALDRRDDRASGKPSGGRGR